MSESGASIAVLKPRDVGTHTELRALPQLRGIRLVALTGYGRSEDRQRTQDAGFDDHLVKPVGLATLTRALNDSH